MHWFTRAAIWNRWLTLLVVFLIMGISVISLFQLKTELIPDIELPYIAVVGISQGNSPEEIIENISIPAEGEISKVGGLTRARQIRDLCLSSGIAMTIEDTWGGDVTTAAIAHLAHSTPERFLFSATDFNSYVTVSFADGAPQRSNGRLAASREPGLGVTPRLDLLGDPVLEVSEAG